MTTHSRRVPALLLGAAILLTLVSACTIPSRPAWWPHPAVTGPAVRDPWHSGMRQLGIQVYWTANRNDSADAVIRAKAQRIVDYAISLHANSVT